MKKILTLVLASLMSFSLVACSKKEDDASKATAETTTTPEASETTAPIAPDTNDDYDGEVFDYATVFPGCYEYYSLELGTSEKTCTITVPSDYTLTYANVQKDGESSPVSKTGATIKEEVEGEDFDPLALYSALGLKSADSSVELDVQAYKFGNGVSLESFDSLFEGNKAIEELAGTAARCAVQTDVQGYDFNLYIEVNGENCVQIGYKGDGSVDAKEMALNVYHLIALQ